MSNMNLLNEILNFIDEKTYDDATVVDIENAFYLDIFTESYNIFLFPKSCGKFEFQINNFDENELVLVCSIDFDGNQDLEPVANMLQYFINQYK